MSLARAYTGLLSNGAAKIEFDTNRNGCRGDSGGTVVQPLAPPNQLLVGLFSGTLGPDGSPACTANGEFLRSDAVAWWLQYARGYQMVGAP